MPVPLMSAFVFAPGRMVAGAALLVFMPVPLTCAELRKSPTAPLEVAPLVPALGLGEASGLFVRGGGTADEFVPTMNHGVAAAPSGNFSCGGLLIIMGSF